MAILKFKYGFEYKGFEYGWLLEELWRLPSKSGSRLYPLKKLKKVKGARKGFVGYRLKQDLVSMAQLQSLTKTINKEFEFIRKSKDTPF